MPNVTAVNQFILLGFSSRNCRLCVKLISSSSLSSLWTCSFFLKNLSLLDVFLVSVPIPNFIVNSLTRNSSISILGCAFQIFLMTSFSRGDVFVLTAMSYDCSVAICCLLHYEAIMGDGACMLMAGFSWATGVFFGAIYTAGTFSMNFCDPLLLRISCSGTLVVIYSSIGIGMCPCMSCFICVVISCFYIFSTVMKIPTTKGQSKAFGTCLPHLIVFTIFTVTACFVYLKTSSNSPVTDRLFAMINTVLPPAFNPVIYSLRNAVVNWALKRLLHICSRLSLHITLQTKFY
uniref:G-protein coupled receptors family 1 profile domain-containing protein n=1 Tax=Nannospalax galili TaxID=1026970 RepID=A0A8C6W4H3_NANGA